MNPDTDITPFTKINSKLIMCLNVEYKTVKLLGDNMGENLDVLEFGGVFLDTTPQARSIIDKLYFIKIKHFCTMKENIKRMRRQATVLENIFRKDTSGIGLLCKIYEELLKGNPKKTINLIKKMRQRP